MRDTSAECPACGGRGRCPACGGKGQRSFPGPVKIACSNCDGTGRCRVCSGSTAPAPSVPPARKPGASA